MDGKPPEDWHYVPEQNVLAEQIDKFGGKLGKKLRQAYRGAIYSLHQKDDPDRFVHFAHSER